MYHIKNIIFTCFLLAFCSYESFSQSVDTKEDLGNLNEKIVLLFDRETYSVQETVHFKAFNLSSEQLKELDWSKVLYVELITCDGRALFQSKFKFGKDGGEGSFKIPKQIITGNYYIKAYTKWMRNFSNAYYFYTPITVVNPHLDQVAQKPEMYEPDFTLDTVFYDNADIELAIKDSVYPFNSKVSIEVSRKPNKLNADSIELVIEGRKVKFLKSEVSHLLGNEDKALNNSLNFRELYTVSVVKAETASSFRVLPKPINYSKEFNLKFIPETRGVSVSGKLLSASGQGIPRALVHISVFNGYTETQSALTDSLGNFIFAIPELYGAKEILVMAQVEQEHKVLIDNDYCSKPVYLPFIPFQLNAQKHSFYNSLVKNGQVENQYTKVDSTQLVDTILRDVVYYNNANQKINLGEFVQMPSLEDYMRELLTLLIIEKQNDKTKLRVYGAFSELSLYPPLVMIDHVVVTDIDRLLAVDPKEIKTIEVLSYPYIKGNVIYGGVVNFFSNKNDLAKMELPETGLYFDYNFFNINSTKAKTNEVLLSNVLYWDANCKFKDDLYNINFNTGLNTGKYVLRIAGVNSEGTYFLKEQEIEIE